MDETSTPGSQADSQKPETGKAAAAPSPVAALFEGGRPDWFPEKYWSAGDVPGSLQKLGQGYAETAKFVGAKEEEWRKRVDGERLKARPEKPEAYKLAPPKSGVPDDLVILDKAPDDKFRPEPDKRYFVLDEKHPMLEFWRKHAWENGLSQQAFEAGIAAFAAAGAADTPTQREIAEMRRAVYAELGEHGERRAAHVRQNLQAALGGDEAGRALFAALEDALSSAKAIEALERILEKGGAARFAPGDVPGGGADLTLEALQKMQKDPEYYKDPALFRKVSEGYARLEKQGRLKRPA